MDKYQTRKTQRTPAQIKEFSDKIKLQGQLEPVHLVKEGEDFQLLAGFGRLEALKILKSKTIKAIVYENFSDYEIMTYSFGTNENRLELSEIDKIWSVGEFVFKHPEMLLDSTNPREKTVRNVFGYDRKDIYAFNKMYQYFSTNPAWLELFKTKTYQRYVFDKIMDNTDKIKDVEKFIAKFTELTWENNLEFNLKFNQLFQDIEKQENIDEKITEKIDELESIDDKIENLQEKKLEKKAEEIVDKLLQTDIEETRKKIHDFFDNISKELRKANNHLQKIKDIPDYQKFMQNDDVLVVNKLLDMISKTVTKLV
jgi:vacuolar-type H+-ATPase subunit I/STV1